jgi:hypothetical protein
MKSQSTIPVNNLEFGLSYHFRLYPQGRTPPYAIPPMCFSALCIPIGTICIFPFSLMGCHVHPSGRPFAK